MANPFDDDDDDDQPQQHVPVAVASTSSSSSPPTSAGLAAAIVDSHTTSTTAVANGDAVPQATPAPARPPAPATAAVAPPEPPRRGSIFSNFMRRRSSTGPASPPPTTAPVPATAPLPPQPPPQAPPPPQPAPGPAVPAGAVTRTPFDDDEDEAQDTQAAEDKADDAADSDASDAESTVSSSTEGVPTLMASRVAYMEEDSDDSDSSLQELVRKFARPKPAVAPTTTAAASSDSDSNDTDSDKTDDDSESARPLPPDPMIAATRKIENLEAEITKLREVISKYQSAQKQLTPQEAVNQLLMAELLGESGTTRFYKVQSYRDLWRCGFHSLKDKHELVTAAETTQHCDVIRGVLNFVQGTLGRRQFGDLLKAHPAAFQVYATDQRQHPSPTLSALTQDPVAAGWFAQARHKDFVRESFALILGMPDVTARVTLLEHLVAHMASNPGCVSPFMSTQYSLVLDLYKRQVAIDDFDARLAQRGDNIFLRFPRYNISGSSLDTTLRYCTLYHPTVPAEKLSSPKGIIAKFGRGDAAFLESRAKVGDWAALDGLVRWKRLGGLVSSRPKCKLGFRALVDTVVKYHGPRSLLAKYAALIEDPIEAIGVCQAHYLFELQIEVLATRLKDQVGLLSLKSQLISLFGAIGAKSYVAKIDEALANPKIKWKVIAPPPAAPSGTEGP